jgi:hypothetical protein
MTSVSYLQPQAALETAVRDAIRVQLGYNVQNCDRTFDDTPHPRAGMFFVAVWSPGGRTNGKGRRVALDQIHNVKVTVFARINRPFDRLVQHRDEVEARMNAIVALVHRDSLDHALIAAANVLAGYRPAYTVTPPEPTHPVGFVEALAWERTEDIELVGGEALGLTGKEAALSQTASFGSARRVQSQGTAQ